MKNIVSYLALLFVFGTGIIATLNIGNSAPEVNAAEFHQVAEDAGLMDALQSQRCSAGSCPRFSALLVEVS